MQGLAKYAFNFPIILSSSAFTTKYELAKGQYAFGFLKLLLHGKSVSICVRVHVCACVCVCVCAHTCVHACVYACVHAET